VSVSSFLRQPALNQIQHNSLGKTEDENFTVIGSRVLETHEQAHTAAVCPSRAGYGMPAIKVEQAHGLV
jgi:hypothetical protein